MAHLYAEHGLLHGRMWTLPCGGCPAEKFYRAIGAVHDFGAEAGFKIDVIDPAECSREMVQSIQTEGIEL